MKMRIIGGAFSLLLALLGGPASAATITVNSTADVAADDGQCTLREAITAANPPNAASGAKPGECAAGEASPTVDTVAFAIPGAGVHTIAPTSSLPSITEAVLIDGYTQPGNGGPAASPNTLAVGDDAVLLIEISGASAPGLTMISITGPAGDSTVRGLVINQTNAGHAIVVGASVASSNNTITGNFIGLDPTGTTVPGSGRAPDVFFALGSANTFGGTTPAARNVMAGSSCCGSCYLGLDSVTGSFIQGNYFGTNASGTAALSGGVNGICVLSNGNTIGGTAAGAGNVIAGTGDAILLSGAVPGGGSNNVIQGNRIGTNAAGTAALGNLFGIATNNGGGNNLVGGSAAGAGNLISGNGTGIFLGDSAHAYTIHGNLIGTDVTGTLPVPNSGNGIQIFTAPAGTSVGGPAPGDGNVIAFNGGQGVAMINSAALTGLPILGNSIFANGGLGISLDNSSTPIENDAGDVDTGANDLQNFPVLDTEVVPAGGSTSVTGTLDSTAGHTFRIEVFANDVCDPSLRGEGKTFVGTTDTAPNVTFTVNFGQTLAAGTMLTATATDLTTNDTSEFSACPVPPPTPTPTPTRTATPIATLTVSAPPTSTPTGGLAASATPTPTPPTPTSTPVGGVPLGHFVAYQVKVAKSGPKFFKLGPVTLADPTFGFTADYDVKKPTLLAVPANKNGEGFTDPVTHLEAYALKLSKGSPRFAPRVDVAVTNQCGDLMITAKKPTSLLVPTGVDVAAVAPNDVDHFLCYQAKAQKKLANGTPITPFPKKVQVDVVDAFQTRRYDLKKVAALCVPVAKSGSPLLLAGPSKGTPFALTPATVGNPAAFLVCYQAKLATKTIAQDGCGPADPGDKGKKLTPKQPKHVPHLAVQVGNQLGGGVLDTKKESLVCVPSGTR